MKMKIKLLKIGINYRHIGKLMIETQDIHSKRILMMEMIARVIKKIIQDENRKQMSRIQIPTQGPFINIVINIINQLLNKDDGIWKSIMIGLESKFNISSDQLNEIKKTSILFN